MKRQWMKQLAISLIVMGVAVSISAQRPEGLMKDAPQREIPSPEANARRITREFKKTFQLTDKEYEKVYDLYLKQERSLMPSQGNQAPPWSKGGPRGGFGGPMGGFGSPMGGPEMSGGMPPQGGFQGGEHPMPGDMKAFIEDMRKEQEKKQQKASKTLKKKMKKILSKEQFEQWEQWETERIDRHRPDIR